MRIAWGPDAHLKAQTGWHLVIESAHDDTDLRQWNGLKVTGYALIDYAHGLKVRIWQPLSDGVRIRTTSAARR
jgi:hypothetical protein